MRQLFYLNFICIDWRCCVNFNFFLIIVLIAHWLHSISKSIIFPLNRSQRHQKRGYQTPLETAPRIINELEELLCIRRLNKQTVRVISEPAVIILCNAPFSCEPYLMHPIDQGSRNYVVSNVILLIQNQIYIAFMGQKIQN